MKRFHVASAVVVVAVVVGNVWGQVQYTVTDLGTLGGSTSQATGINNLGQVVGNAAVSTGYYYAFLYSSGTMSDLGILGGGDSFADGINASGQVVGYGWASTLTDHAFLYSKEGCS
jgi:probable HAF family extracellular repeat protein